VDDPRDYIDPDEGREIDYDSALVQPFYANALPCENCGEPTEERHPAEWNPEILVGPCCKSPATEFPREPVCFRLYQIMLAAKTVGEMMDSCKAHKHSCPVCGGARKIAEAA
jgi:rRNA maturation protein Nop10